MGSPALLEEETAEALLEVELEVEEVEPECEAEPEDATEVESEAVAAEPETAVVSLLACSAVSVLYTDSSSFSETSLITVEVESVATIASAHSTPSVPLAATFGVSPTTEIWA